MKKVCVLMSTYNGERYIKEQIDSILNQKNVDIKLLIRDDGSKDSTVSIIKEYQEKTNNQVELYPSEKNIGFAESFWELLLNAPKADYYAFSDQDDYWLEDKIAIAVNYLVNKTIPCLYASNFWLVDEKLKKIDQEQLFSMETIRPENLIITNTRACGNTMVWNQKLQDLVLLHPEKEMITTYHDIRLEFMAAMLGEFYIDSNRTILYRQHTNNVSGGSVTTSKKYWLKGRWKQVKKRLFGSEEEKHYEEYRAKIFLKNYSCFLQEEKISALNTVINYRKSIRNTIKLLNSDVCKGVATRVKIRILLHKV